MLSYIYTQDTSKVTFTKFGHNLQLCLLHRQSAGCVHSTADRFCTRAGWKWQTPGAIVFHMALPFSLQVQRISLPAQKISLLAQPYKHMAQLFFIWLNGSITCCMRSTIWCNLFSSGSPDLTSDTTVLSSGCTVQSYGWTVQPSGWCK